MREKAKNLQNEILKQNKKALLQDNEGFCGKFHNLSYPEMIRKQNLSQPRKIINGEHQLISLSAPTGFFGYHFLKGDYFKGELPEPQEPVDEEAWKIMIWLRKAKFKLKNHVSKWYVKDEERGESVDLLEEQLGTGVIMYFRMLKVVIAFFLFCTLVQSPLMATYSHGKIGDGTLNWLSLGNLGFNYFSCNKRNLRISDTISFKCEYGAKMESLYEFGIQK